MIKRIQIAGLRGKSFDLTLDPVSLIVGANTAGKTTIADAIRWGLLGTIPGMNTPPRGWGDLLKDNAASVELTLDNGKTIVRSMMLQGGSVKMQDLGRADGVNVLSLDPSQFFEATGPRKAQLVAEASVYDGFDWKVMVPKELQQSAKAHASWAGWAGKALDDAKTKRADLAAQKKMYAETIRGLESIRELVIEDDTQKKTKLGQMQEKLGVLKETIKACDNQISVAKQPRAKTETQRQLDGVLRQLQDYIGWTHDVTTVEAREKANAAAIAKLVKKGAVSPDWIASLTHNSSQESLTLNTLRAQIAQIQLTLGSLEAKYARLGKSKCCPTCGTAGVSFKAAIAKLEAEEARPYKERKLTLDGELVQHEEALKKASETLDKAQAQFNKQGELEDERQKLTTERRLIGLWDMHDGLVKQLQAATVPLDIAALEERRYEIECDIEDLSEAIQALEAEVGQIAYNRSQKRRMQEIEQALAKAEEGWTVANAQVAAVEGLRAKFTAMSLVPILHTLEVFTKGIFKEPVALEGNELGRMIGHRWVPITQFSGAEQAVAMAALTCALRVRDAENIVIVDEMGSFDDEHLKLFIRNVRQAVEDGLLSQFVGLTTPRKIAGGIATIIKIEATYG